MISVLINTLFVPGVSRKDKTYVDQVQRSGVSRFIDGHLFAPRQTSSYNFIKNLILANLTYLNDRLYLKKIGENDAATKRI